MNRRRLTGSGSEGFDSISFIVFFKITDIIILHKAAISQQERNHQQLIQLSCPTLFLPYRQPAYPSNSRRAGRGEGIAGEIKPGIEPGFSLLVLVERQSAFPVFRIYKGTAKKDNELKP
jgi:hypothetical protein